MPLLNSRRTFFGIYDVGHHSAGGRQLSRPASVKHRLTKHISVNKHAVEYIVNVAERAGRHHHARRCRGIYRAGFGIFFGVSNKLNGRACLRQQRNILGFNIPYSLDAYRFKRKQLAVSDSRKYDYLPRRVKSVHIGGGVSLGISKLLRATQNIVKRSAVARHFSQDIICCTVEDSSNRIDLIVGKLINKRTNYRDTSADCRLKKISASLLTRDIK